MNQQSGREAMQKQIHPDFGFESMLPLAETRRGLERNWSRRYAAMRRPFRRSS